jgi:hypothetical protein
MLGTTNTSLALYTSFEFAKDFHTNPMTSVQALQSDAYRVLETLDIQGCIHFQVTRKLNSWAGGVAQWYRALA